jgi:hypothetical protein
MKMPDAFHHGKRRAERGVVVEREDSVAGGGSDHDFLPGLSPGENF